MAGDVLVEIVGEVAAAPSDPDPMRIKPVPARALVTKMRHVATQATDLILKDAAAS